jgi:transcriptional/translational regulatory protein YebC/TACO1
MVPKETIDIAGEDLELFNKLLSLLDEVEDVQNVYHNVNL